MAIYAGATARITVTVTDFDGNAVTPAEVTSATVTLYDSLGNWVFQDEALTWDATTSYWYYDWQDSVAGSFTAQATFVGVGYEAFDYGTVRISTPKVTPTGQQSTL